MFGAITRGNSQVIKRQYGKPLVMHYCPEWRTVAKNIELQLFRILSQNVLLCTYLGTYLPTYLPTQAMMTCMKALFSFLSYYLIAKLHTYLFITSMLHLLHVLLVSCICIICLGTDLDTNNQVPHTQQKGEIVHQGLFMYANNHNHPSKCCLDDKLSFPSSQKCVRIHVFAE